jgi:hypothetical protein
MHFIYAHATSVIVWLGEEADDSSEVLHGLDYVSRATKAKISWTGDLNMLIKRLSGPLQAFLARPWFERVWASA